jgi:biotin synthase
MADIAIRHDWSRAEVAALFALPFNELLHRAHAVHRENHDPNAVQVSTLLSIKPAAVPRIAPTARRRRATTPAWPRRN